MSGFGRASFVDGAMKGYEFMDNIQSRKDHRERQAKMDARGDEMYERQLVEGDRRDEQYRHGLERRKVVEGRDDESYANSQADRAERQRLAKKTESQGDEDRTEGKRLAKKAEGIGDESRAEARKNKKINEFNQAVLARYNGVEDENNMYLNGQISAMPTLMDDLMSGKIAPESPEVAKVIELLAPELIDDSKTGAVVGVAGITPETDKNGKKTGKFVIGLKMKDGSVKPVTEGRSADENDPIKQYDLDGLFRRAHALMNANKHFSQLTSDRGQTEAYLRSAGLLKAPNSKNLTQVEKLIAARDALPAGHPDRKIYDSAIKKASVSDSVKTIQDADFNEKLVRVNDDNTFTPITEQAAIPPQESYLKSIIDRGNPQEIAQATQQYQQKYGSLPPWAPQPEAAPQQQAAQPMPAQGAQQPAPSPEVQRVQPPQEPPTAEDFKASAAETSTPVGRGLDRLSGWSDEQKQAQSTRSNEFERKRMIQEVEFFQKSAAAKKAMPANRVIDLINAGALSGQDIQTAVAMLEAQNFSRLEIAALLEGANASLASL